MAGCTIGGDICVWNVNLQTCVMYTRHDRGYSICGLAWNPSGIGEIAYCDVMGQLGTIEDCIQPASGDSIISVSQCWQVPCTVFYQLVPELASSALQGIRFSSLCC